MGPAGQDKTKGVEHKWTEGEWDTWNKKVEADKKEEEAFLFHTSAPATHTKP